MKEGENSRKSEEAEKSRKGEKGESQGKVRKEKIMER